MGLSLTSLPSRYISKVTHNKETYPHQGHHIEDTPIPTLTTQHPSYTHTYIAAQILLHHFTSHQLIITWTTTYRPQFSSCYLHRSVKHLPEHKLTPIDRIYYLSASSSHSLGFSSSSSHSLGFPPSSPPELTKPFTDMASPPSFALSRRPGNLHMPSHSTASSEMDVDDGAVLLATPLHKSTRSRSDIPGAKEDTSFEGIKPATGICSVEAFVVGRKRCVAIRPRSGFRRLGPSGQIANIRANP